MEKFIKKSIIRCMENLGINVENPDANILINDYIGDSVTFISFIVELEQTFDIEIPDAYLNPEKLQSLDEICRIVSLLIDGEGCE